MVRLGYEWVARYYLCVCHCLLSALFVRQLRTLVAATCICVFICVCNVCIGMVEATIWRLIISVYFLSAHTHRTHRTHMSVKNARVCANALHQIQQQYAVFCLWQKMTYATNHQKVVWGYARSAREAPSGYFVSEQFTCKSPDTDGIWRMNGTKFRYS